MNIALIVKSGFQSVIGPKTILTVNCDKKYILTHILYLLLAVIIIYLIYRVGYYHEADNVYKENNLNYYGLGGM